MILNNRYQWSLLKTKNVTVSVTPVERCSYALFRVKNMIDLGSGHQTAVLENVAFPAEYGPGHRKNDLALPIKIANLDLVYTNKKYTGVSNVYEVIRSIYTKGRIEKIVPDVLAPGDYLVFKRQPREKQAALVEALRVITDRAYKRYKDKNVI